MSRFQYGSIVKGSTSTATAAGTTTLVVTSTQIQNFTGSTTQTVVLPSGTTMANGMSYEIFNNSTGLLTINKNGGSLLTTVPTLTSVVVVLTDNSSSAGVWNVQASTSSSTLLGSFTSSQLATALSDETGTGSAVFSTSPTLVTPNLGTPTTLVGTNITGTAASLTVGSATSATTATNIAGGTGGSIPYQSASGTTALLANGTSGQVLTSAGTTLAPTWTSPLVNPMTTGGDIIYGGSAGAATRLANGTSGQVLTSTGGTSAPSWSAPTVALASQVTGTLPIANGGTNNNSLAVTGGGSVYADGSKLATTAAGTSGQVLTSNGAAAPTWQNFNNYALQFSTTSTTQADGLTRYIGAGTLETTAASFPVRVPYAGNITSMVCQSASSGSGTRTYTVYVNNASTAITAAASGASTQCNDGSHTVAVNGGDYIMIQLITSGGSTTTYHNVTLGLNRTS